MLIPCSRCKHLNEVQAPQCEKCGFTFSDQKKISVFEQNKLDLLQPIEKNPINSNSFPKQSPKKTDEKSEDLNLHQIISKNPERSTNENSEKTTYQSLLLTGFFLLGCAALVILVSYLREGPGEEVAISAVTNSSNLVQNTPLKVSSSDIIEGKVIDVINGESVTILDKNNLNHKIKLAGIVSPKTELDITQKAKENLSTLILEKDVLVRLYETTEKNGEIPGKILHGDKDINLEQIKAGLAKYREDFGLSEVDRQLYSEAETAAKTTKTGLWSVSKTESATEQPQQTKTKDLDINVKTPRGKSSDTVNQGNSHSKSSKAVVSTPTLDTSNSTTEKNKDVPLMQPERSANKSSTRTYALGPKGGCYYINSKGNKTYVDRSLCN